MYSALRTVLRATGLAAVALPAASFAIIATTSNTAVSPTDVDLVDSVVGRFGSGGSVGSGIAISPYAILTAKHVTSAVVGGTYTVDQFNSLGAVTSTAGYTIRKVVPDADPNTDLEVVFLQTPLTNFATFASTASLGDTIKMVGVGQSGRVQSSTDAANHVADAASYPGYAGQRYVVTTAQGVRKAGTNTLDLDPSTPSQTGVDDEGYLFSLLKGAGQALVVNGDSGGGWFNAAGQIVGMTDLTANLTPTDFSGHVKYPNQGFAIPTGGSYHFGDYFQTDPTKPNYAGPDFTLGAGDPYCGSYAINLSDPTSDVRQFIDATLLANPVPEPSVLVALGMGAVATLRRKRR